MALNNLTGQDVSKLARKLNESNTTSGYTESFSVIIHPKNSLPVTQIEDEESLPPPEIPSLQDPQIEQSNPEQEALSERIAAEISRTFQEQTAQAAQNFDTYLKEITRQRTEDLAVELSMLQIAISLQIDEIEARWQREKKARVAYMLVNAGILTLLMACFILISIALFQVQT